MEAVAAAASIAGIITVVGQSIDGLIKFSDFFSDVSSASKTITRLLNDINSLIQVLEEIRNIFEQAQARRSGQNLALLDVKLEDCAKDVQIWLGTARLLRPGGSDSGGKAWLRKFRLAVNSTAIQTIREEIGRHKQTLCLSLAVFGRTIDIDTSAQVHQIGGRFTEALSTSLSVHGAHQEALRRIEHYSMTSMHSSAHSIRSMDSIRTELRTELSRLETMITRTSNAHTTEVGVKEAQNHTMSNSTERRSSVGEEAANGESYLSALNSLGEHGIESSTTNASGPKVTSQSDLLNEARNGLISRTQSHRGGKAAVENRIDADSHGPSKSKRSSMGKDDDQSPTREINKVSDLYAEFSKKLEPGRNESTASEIDTVAIHDVLRQSLATIYPPEVVKYISLRQVITLCEDHIDFLDRRPSIQKPAAGKMNEWSYVNSNALATARPSMVELRDRLKGLQKAIKVSREQCIRAGYTLLELDKLLFPAGTGSFPPSDRLPPRPEIPSGNDSSSIYSEDFHSPGE